MVSGIEHLSPGTNDNGTLVFSLLYVCEEKQKEQEQEFKYDLSKAKGNFALIVISLCGRTYQTKTAMWGDMFYSATITLVPPVTLVLHGLLPLHSLYNIHVLLHNMTSPFF